MLVVFLWCLFIMSLLLVLRELLSIWVVIGRRNVVYKHDWVSFISPFLLAFSAFSLLA